MDQRVPFTTKRNGETFALGLRFPSLEAAEKGVDALIAKRELIAGRPLSAKELRDGVSRDDNRAARERIADAQWQPKLPRTPKADDNPFRDGGEFAERFDEPNGGKETREQFRQRSEREWDERKARERDRTSPQRLAAIKESEEALEILRYEPGVTQAQVEHAERVLTQARVGDLSAYREMRDAINEQRIERYGDDAANAQERIEQAQAEFAASQLRMAALRPQQQQQPANLLPGDRVDRMHAPGQPDEIVVLRKGDKYDRVVHRWPADQAPAEVAALAPASQQ